MGIQHLGTPQLRKNLIEITSIQIQRGLTGPGRRVRRSGRTQTYDKMTNSWAGILDVISSTLPLLFGLPAAEAVSHLFC
uniref:Uncharacterized protein n=1 Tax=Oryza rufipogon TaxID=4529 RepID=A0A0E0RHS3_ORYRU